MKKYIFILVSIVCVMLCSCEGAGFATKESVVEEIYKGKEYMTVDEAATYLSELLGENATEYDIEIYGDFVRFSLKESKQNTDWVERTVGFSDGSSIALPCNYSDVSSLGWKSEDSENETWTPSSMFYCRNKTGWKIGFLRNPESNKNNVKIKYSRIKGLSITCGDFAKKDDYTLILSSHPEFKYMGIDRKSTPTQVIQKIGLPTIIDHNGINMTFEYECTDYSIDERISVEITWLTLEDGPEIMRDFHLKISTF